MKRAAEDPYLSTAAVAALLNIDKRTLQRYRSNGGGPRFIKLGPGKRAKILYLRTDIDQWLASRTFRVTAEYQNVR